MVVVFRITRTLKISANELPVLEPALKAARRPEVPAVCRLWKQFQKVFSLSEKDGGAVIRVVSSLGTGRHPRYGGRGMGCPQGVCTVPVSEGWRQRSTVSQSDSGT